MVTRINGTNTSESMTHFPIRVMEILPITFLREIGDKLDLKKNDHISSELKFNYWRKRWKVLGLKKQSETVPIELRVTDNRFIFEHHA